jgi:hypothetical protein
MVGTGGRQQILMDSLKFSREELMLNKNGQLSERQQQLVKRGAGCARGSLLVTGIVFLVMIGGIGYFLYSSGQFESLQTMFEDDPNTFYLVAGVLALVAIIVLWSFARSAGVTARMGKGEVSSVSGEVRIQLISTDFGDSVRLHIGRVQFHLTPEMSEGFEEGKNYTIYYVHNPPANVILSAEWLGI